MSFKILLLAPDADPSWPEKIRRAVPGVVVNTYSDPQDALDDIADADAAYGTVPPELLARARKLRWICAARAGLGGALVLRRAGQRSRKRSKRCTMASRWARPATSVRRQRRRHALSSNCRRRSTGSSSPTKS